MRRSYAAAIAVFVSVLATVALGQEAAPGGAAVVEPAAVVAPTPIGAPAPQAQETSSAGEPASFTGQVYGYIAPYVEKVINPPVTLGSAATLTKPETQSELYAFDITNLNVMFQGTVGTRYRYFLNLAGPGGDPVNDSPIVVRNAWLEAALLGDYLTVRAGKTYRMWGIYNEILDAMPTFIGIEPPEMFDKDHLMITRVTNLVLHGQASFEQFGVQYAMATGNDERDFDGTREQLPLGLDLRLSIGDLVTVGADYYTTGGNAKPSRGVGDGSPDGGVINWMDHDNYRVYGAFAQTSWHGIVLQIEGAYATHKAMRDAAAVMQIDQATLNDTQRARFWSDPSAPTFDNVIPFVSYVVQTYYVRAGYELQLRGEATLTPYAQWDYYSNPETIWKKKFGGDKEAGMTDDGKFMKYTVGAVYRPISAVALKLDGSMHDQTIAGATLRYPEVRLSFSYFWELASL